MYFVYYFRFIFQSDDVKIEYSQELGGNVVFLPSKYEADVNNLLYRNNSQQVVCQVRVQQSSSKKHSTASEPITTTLYTDGDVQRQKTKYIVQKDTKEEATKIPCKYCGKLYTKGYQHSKHMLGHLKPKPFKCDQCDAAYSQHSSLRVHRLIHSGT